MATTLEIGLQTSYSQAKDQDAEQDLHPHRKPIVVPKIQKLGEKEEEVGKDQQLPSPRQVSLGQAAGTSLNSFLLLPYYDGGGRREKESQMRSRELKPPVKDRLLFEAPELEYLNKQPNHQYLPVPPKKSKDVVPRLVMKKNRNYFNLDERQSLAPKYDWLPLSKKIEMRLTQAQQLLEGCSNSEITVKERIQCTENEKKIKSSKAKLKSVRLSNLAHLSAIRTISPHQVSVRSTSEAILKMVQDFYNRFLCYVQGEIDKIYTQALIQELDQSGKRRLGQSFYSRDQLNRMTSSRLDKYIEERTPTERRASAKQDFDFLRQNAMGFQKMKDPSNRMLDQELLD